MTFNLFIILIDYNVDQDINFMLEGKTLSKLLEKYWRGKWKIFLRIIFIIVFLIMNEINHPTFEKVTILQEGFVIKFFGNYRFSNLLKTSLFKNIDFSKVLINQNIFFW